MKNNEPQNYAPSHGSKGNAVERNGYYTSRISVSQLSKHRTIKLVQNEKKMKNIRVIQQSSFLCFRFVGKEALTSGERKLHRI